MNKTAKGFTLIEMLVTLVVLSILAGMTVPYAELIVVRQKEYELREALRDIRTAIDKFHYDWEQGKIQNNPDIVSVNGFPVKLEVLIEGVQDSSADGLIIKYLRRIPKDPFANTDTDNWRYIGYQDSSDTESWNGEDVYDIRSQSPKQAIDKSFYAAW